MLLGLIKKVCVADVLAVTLVDPVFNDPSRFSGPAVLLAVYGYAMQVYCDFSGYSDIAIGAAQVLGFDLPVNFRQALPSQYDHRLLAPLAYLFVELVEGLRLHSAGRQSNGSAWPRRKLNDNHAARRTWHGADQPRMVGRSARPVSRGRAGIYRGSQHADRSVASGVITFHLVCLGWILFRPDSVGAATMIVGRILTMASGDLPLNAPFVAALALGYFAHLSPPEWKDALRRIFCDAPPLLQSAAITACILLFVSVDVGKVPFIYFQF